MLRRILFILSIVLVLPVTAEAQSYDDGTCPTSGSHCIPTSNVDGSTTIDPKLKLIRQVITTEGLDSPVFGPSGAPSNIDDDAVSVTVRFDETLSEAQLDEYNSRGLRFRLREGKKVRVGAIYLATMKWSALDDLAQDEQIERIESTWSPTLWTPLNETSEIVGAAQAQVHPELDVDGDGVTIVDIDDGFDVFHPHMFHADGELYQWHDEDNTGRFDPGVDTVDIDGQKVTLRVLHAPKLDRDGSGDPAGGFDPRRDWLYADISGNQERDVGPDHGFAESDPAYGEPIFVVDDVNRNGELDPGEKLVRLDTSKFKKVVHDDHIFRRGENLIDAMDIQFSTHHGTGVTSILAGGQPGFHDRVGLAPGAELIGHGYFIDNDDSEQGGYTFEPQLNAINDAIDSGAQILLHEWTDIATMAFDGSSHIEQMMDTARDEDIIQVNPVGNLNEAGKHIHREAAAGETVDLQFYVDDGFSRGGQSVPYAVVYMSLFWQADHMPQFTLIGPDDTEVELEPSADQFGDANLYTTFQETMRGTRQQLIYLWNENPQISLETGTYTLRIEGLEHDDAVTGRITDQYSSWGLGIYWHDATQDFGTAVYPSSADSAFGVAAFAGRHSDFSAAPGDLRGYSGRGPRLDGAPMVDIAAPDDPYAALTTSDEFGPNFQEPAAFMTFGGTSGAGPHVAAAFALMMEKYPEWDAELIEEKLLDSTERDELAPDFGALPNRHWGEGQVDVFAALHGDPRQETTPELPQAELEIIAEGGQDIVFDASNSVDPDGGPLEYRFDLSYDGYWNQNWSDEPTLSASPSNLDVGSEYKVRLDVRTAEGARSGALGTFVAPDDSVPEPEPEDEDDEGDEDDDSPTLQVVEQDGRCTTTGGTPNSTFWLVFMALGLIAFSRRRQS